MASIESIPGWVEVLVDKKFFKTCLVHLSHKKNEDNSFCLDCCISLCLHCLPSHSTHRLLQIRRYMYQDVLRLKDAENLMDCSFIQSYITNSAKVVFLKQRPTRRSEMKTSGNCCVKCQQSLQYPYLFCSIFCKVNYIMNDSRKPLLYEDEDCLVEVESTSVVQTLVPLATLSSSTGSTKFKDFDNPCLEMKAVNRCTGFMSGWSEGISSTNRRKNVPRRAPLS